VGSLTVVAENAERVDAVSSHVLQIARGIYSMPPDHGAAIAAHVLTDSVLRRDWVAELSAMRTRITEMRALLADNLQRCTGGSGFDFIRTQRGMFSLLGVSGAAVDVLRERHHIYMLGDSRMNLAGVMPQNAAYVAAAVAATLATERAA
jgi:aspartate aminotransferase